MISRFIISGWGAYLPRGVLTSREMDQTFGHPLGWTEQEFGITARHRAAPDETTSMMATEAARAALSKANWGDGLPDVIIGACGVMEQPIPSTATLVQHQLGLGRSGISCFDVNQTCLSFLAALDVAAMGLATRRWKRALVFSSDIASAGLNPQAPKTRSIFGDGAAALAIEACPDADLDSGLDAGRGLVSIATQTLGQHHALAQLRSGGTRLRIDQGYDAVVEGSYFEMDAFGIFKAAAKILPGVIEQALAQAGVTPDDLDCIVCHQASAPGVEHVRRLFAPKSDRVVSLFATQGNQIAASIPSVLAHALTTGQAQQGNLVLLLGTSAGISATAMVIRL